MRIRFKSLAARLALSLTSLVVALLLLEVLFRAIGIQAEYHEPRKDNFQPRSGGPNESVLHGFVPYSVIRTTYDSDPRGYFGADHSIDHKFNSVGWRDVEHAIEKPKGTFRILGLGDSYLYGQGVKRDDVCLIRLEKRLADSIEQSRFETINAGQSSLNTAQERDVLLHRGLEYDPDLVILHFVLNDVEQPSDLFRTGPKVEFTTEFVGLYQTPDAASKYSYFWSWCRQRYLRQVRGSQYIQQCLQSFTDNSEKWEQCRQALDDIQMICREREIKLLVVVFPFFHNLDGDYPFQPIHDTLIDYCQLNQIPALDLRDHYRNFRGPELWVHPTDQHPNEIAHEIAAKSIADYLLKHRELIAPAGSQ